MQAIDVIMQDLRKRIDELQKENEYRAQYMRENEIKIAAYKEQLGSLQNLMPRDFVCTKQQVSGGY